MTAWFRGWGALAAVGLMVVMGAGCLGKGSAPREEARKVLVVASIPPLADFARQVGGERVQVETLVQPGMSPHTFEPTPAQLKAISRASVLVLNGVGLEPWADELIEAAGNEKLEVVRTAEGLEIIDERSHGQGRASGNPHVWLDPMCAMHQVEWIWQALTQADPAGGPTYDRNAHEYGAQLSALDREIAAATAGFETKRFVAQHAVWTYFAKRYGLEEAGVVETTPGREPTPGEIAEIVRTVKETGVRAIFAERQLSQKAAGVIAAESGAKVVVLDPLGADYLAMMRENVEKMREGLG